MTARLVRLTLLAALVLSANSALAQRTPATFNHPDNSLQSRIVFPELRGDSVAQIRCAAQVQRNGKFEQNVCFVEKAGDEVFIKAINEAAKKARMNPAIIDGKTAAVYVQYMVVFTKAGDSQTVRIFNNPGIIENTEAYGVEHIAAQRGLTAEKWQKTCPSRVRFMVLVKAHVSEEGVLGSVSIDPVHGAAATERCLQAITDTLNESLFTPAMADGEPVPSTFVEPFGS
jgi:hypothetical protein